MPTLKVKSEVAGTVWKVEVEPGQAVAAGDVLVIVESMKMEIPVEAPRAGTVAAVLVAAGEPIAENAPAVELTVA
jgi:biotin carboxyl carrier protein